MEKLLFCRKLFLDVTLLLSAIILTLTIIPAWAQQGNLDSKLNQNVALRPANGFNNLSVHVTPDPDGATPVLRTFDDEENVINDSDSEFSRWRPTLGLLLIGERFLEVRDNAATGPQLFPAGSFAGFVIGTAGILDVNSTITLAAYNGDSKVGSDYVVPQSQLLALSVLGSSKGLVGFHPTGAFNRIRITFNVTVGVASVRDVYYAVVKKYAEPSSTDFSCNTLKTFGNPVFPVNINYSKTGLSGNMLNLDIAENISDLENITDADPGTAATLNALAGTTGSVFASVKSYNGSYSKDVNAGDDLRDSVYVGFDIESDALLNLNLGILGNITINTFLNNSPVESKTSDDLLLSAQLLSNTSRTTVGFVTTKEFDEVQIVLNTGVLNVLGSTKIYRAVINRFCAAALPACNTITSFTNPGYPVYLTHRTGVTGLIGLNRNIENPSAVLTPTPGVPGVNDYAVLTEAVDAGVSTSIAVRDALNDYPVGTFAGFDIETRTLLTADLLGLATIRLYRDNSPVPVDAGTGNALLLGAQTSLLSGEDRSRQVIGIVAEALFDEVEISFEKVAGVDLGQIRVYNAVIQNNCASVLHCNTSYALTAPEFGVVIESSRTGVIGLADVQVTEEATVTDPWNVISPSTDDFARITNTAGVGVLASVSVANGADTYPVGTFAGFAIKKVTGLALVDLLGSITISTYLDGDFRESFSSIGLLNLTAVWDLFGVPSDYYYPGFFATQTFDEIRLSVGSLAEINVLDGAIDVYGAFIDTRRSAGASLFCLTTNPDMNTGYRNKLIAGDVSTNDVNNTGGDVTYGPVTADAGNPNTTDVPTLNDDGSYTFQTAQAGVYRFEIPACYEEQTTDCRVETLTITVLDPPSTTNEPVVNPDIAIMTGDDDTPGNVVINVLANDGPGNRNNTLGTPEVITQPANGTATVNGEGKVVYTPDAGFYGEDILVYEVCEDPSGECSTAEVKVTVLPSSRERQVAASDDYKNSPNNQSLVVQASSGVLVNDSDSEGDDLTATLLSPGMVAGVGTLSMNSNGGYTFQPAEGFTGSVGYVYQVCNENDDCAAATLYITIYDASTLPVRLSRFDVRPENRGVLLGWTTAQEKNSAYFEVQHSTDGKAWHALGRVEAVGESLAERRYAFPHDDPSSGYNYYRLKLVDKDASFELSDIRSVLLATDAGKEAGIFPNPAGEMFYIRNVPKEQVKEVGIYTMSGHRIQSTTWKDEGIAVENLAPGLYLVSIRMHNGMVDIRRLIIKR